MTQLILERENAEELFEVLCNGQLSQEALAMAFTNVLSRGLEKPNAPAACSPDDKDYFARAERMFELMFSVEPAAMPIEQIIQQCATACTHLLNRATEATIEGEPDMAEMYTDDRNDYLAIQSLFTEGKLSEAYDRYRDLDTASRDNMFIGLDGRGSYALNLALNQLDELES